MTTQQEAAGRYYDRFHHELVSLAASIISWRQFDLCEDIVQSAFEQFLSANLRALATGKRASPDTDRQCRSYLEKVVVLKCVRLKRRLKDEENLMSTDALDSLTATQHSEIEDLEHAERDEQVRQAIGSLKFREQDILLSKVLNRETYKCLAARFHLSCGTVGSVLHVIKRKLQCRLGSDFEYGCRVPRHRHAGHERPSIARPPRINPDDALK